MDKIIKLTSSDMYPIVLKMLLSMDREETTTFKLVTSGPIPKFKQDINNSLVLSDNRELIEGGYLLEANAMIDSITPILGSDFAITLKPLGQ